MKKEIGSIFPLSNQALCEAEATEMHLSDDKVYYSLCREALSDIAVSLSSSNRKVLIPAYTCQTVITPFEEAGWECFFFPIKRNLRIDITGFLEAVSRHNPSVIVIHPYFGMELNAEEESALQFASQDATVVLDLTQCLFSTKRYPFVAFTVGSYRKWFPIPDGGFLENNHGLFPISQPKTENTEFTEREIAAMYLRGQYFGNAEQRTKTISIRLSKAADHLAESNITPHRISSVAYNLLQKEGFDIVQQSRIHNFAFLYQHIQDCDKVKKVCQNLADVTTAPLYFAIYVDDRSRLQRLLAQNAIYAPVIWSVRDEKLLIDEEVRYIFGHVLAIPCDQRYNEDDMRRVVEIINNFCNEQENSCIGSK